MLFSSYERCFAEVVVRRKANPKISTKESNFIKPADTRRASLLKTE